MKKLILKRNPIIKFKIVTKKIKRYILREKKVNLIVSVFFANILFVIFITENESLAARDWYILYSALTHPNNMRESVMTYV